MTRFAREAKCVVGLANHTYLISRDGTERLIADSGAPIFDSNGEIIGVVLVLSWCCLGVALVLSWCSLFELPLILLVPWVQPGILTIQHPGILFSIC